MIEKFDAPVHNSRKLKHAHVKRQKFKPLTHVMVNGILLICKYAHAYVKSNNFNVKTKLMEKNKLRSCK